MQKLIDKNAQKRYFEDLLNEHERNLFLEITSHARFSLKNVQKFHSQIDLLKRVKF